MSRLRAAISVIRDARWIEIRDVAEAELALLQAQAMRWVRPLGQLVEVAEESPSPPSPEPTASDCKAAERFAIAVNRATRYGLFHPKCLARAVALTRLLDSHGISGHRIRIGVRRIEGSFTAHAWVELGKGILGDNVWTTRTYVPLANARVVRTGRPGAAGRKLSVMSVLPRGDSLWDQ
jgi:hypothetical protein